MNATQTKLCNGCGQTLTIDHFTVRRTTSKKTGLRIRKGWTSKCKRCIKQAYRARQKAKAVEPRNLVKLQTWINKAIKNPQTITVAGEVWRGCVVCNEAFLLTDNNFYKLTGKQFSKACKACEPIKRLGSDHAGRTVISGIIRSGNVDLFNRALSFAQRHPQDKSFREKIVSLEDLLTAAKAQNFSCAICKTSFRSEQDVIDHDHTTSEFRGLLCGNCNRGLGMFKDNAESLRIAASYLDKK